MTRAASVNHGLKIAVIGGSLGGLFAAFALQRAGFEVDVYERSGENLKDRGAGLRMQQDLIDRLRDGGLKIETSAVSSSCFRFLGPSGEVVHEESTEITYTSWTRLYNLLRETIGPDRYHLGAQAVAIATDAPGCVVSFADGTAHRADLVVAADGLTSSVRQWLAPAEVPRYAGYVCWRGVVSRDALSMDAMRVLGDAAVYVMPPSGHLSMYPIPAIDGSSASDYNMVWYRPVPPHQLPALLRDGQGTQRQWSVPAGQVKRTDIDALHAAAARELPPAIAELVMKIEAPFIQVIVDVEVTRMVHGRTCLIGDAAFSGRPHLGAGTAKAAGDAWTLAEALSRRGSIEDALVEWEVQRLALGRRYVEVNRELGDGLVAGRVAPQEFTSRASWTQIVESASGGNL